MDSSSDKVADQIDEVIDRVTVFDYINIGVSLVLGAFLMWTAIDTLFMIAETRKAPTGGPGTPLADPGEAPVHTTNGRIRVVKGQAPAHDNAS